MTAELRDTGISLVGPIPWGSHFCHFYETKQDLLDILVPYFDAGLRSNEFCVWVVFDPISLDEAKNIILQTVADGARHLAENNIEIIPHYGWYLHDGAIDLYRILEGWQKKLDQALTKGYSGLRANGIESWLTEKEWMDFSRYEKELNQLIFGQRMIVVCTYPLAASGATEIFDVARTHQFAIAKRHGNWEVLETPGIMKSKVEIENLNTELEQRVNDRTKALQECNQELEQEIHQRKRAEEDVSKQKEILQKIFDHITVMIALFDENGRFVLVNREWVNTLGWTLEEIQQQNIDIIAEFYPDPAEREQAVKFISESKGEWADFKIRTRDGRTIDTIWAIVHLQDGTRIGFGLDTTERKQLDDQLRQTQKMEAVGQLAGGVAHDFNNMLGVIIGHAELAMLTIDSAEVLHSHLREILKAAKHSADLTRQLLAFGRKQKVSPRILDLNECISGVLIMLRRLIGEEINLIWLPAPDLWKIKMDPSQIDQILANLAVNARDAIAGTGNIILESGNVEFNDTPLPVQGVDLGRYVQLAVSDDGCGMGKETLAHIFDPFFTTKGEEGTGLGLATVYGIVKQNNGFINVFSEAGKGTTFNIYFPWFEVGTDSLSEEQSTKSIQGGAETVLLVEDEAMVLNFSKRMLEILGYTVLTANTPREAIRQASHYAKDIHLLITDVVMPEMNGYELAEQLKSIKPNMKWLFMSGYASKEISQHGVPDEHLHFIQKPFSMNNLSQKIREALESSVG